MGGATIEVTGPDAERLARELRAALVAAAEPGQQVAPVEVTRSAELVIAVIGLVFSGASTAKTMWDWWRPRQPSGVTVNVLLADGTRIDLSETTPTQLQTELEQRTELERRAKPAN
jgi:hypothetical protein